jgi:hypothetical protein
LRSYEVQGILESTNIHLFGIGANVEAETAGAAAYLGGLLAV